MRSATNREGGVRRVSSEPLASADENRCRRGRWRWRRREPAPGGSRALAPLPPRSTGSAQRLKHSGQSGDELLRSSTIG
eukprot:scaffold15804_cov60-Phaeocystis_antarctica.AAC.4